MAGLDYCKCHKCGKRLFYDAHLFDEVEDLGCLAALCNQCFKKYEIVVCNKKKALKLGGRKK